MNLVGKVSSSLRIYGFGVFRVAITKLFSHVARIDTLLIYSMQAGRQQPLKHHQDSRLNVGRIDPAHEGLLERLSETYPEKDFAERALNPGVSCYVALFGEDVCGYAWTTRNEWQIDEVDYIYPIARDEFFIFDCFVSPLHRGAGIYPAMLARILCDHGNHDEWPGRAIIGVTSVNRPSIRGIEKAGFVLIGSITCARLLRFRKWWHNKLVNPYADDLSIPGQSY